MIDFQILGFKRGYNINVAMNFHGSTSTVIAIVNFTVIENTAALVKVHMSGLTKKEYDFIPRHLVILLRTCGLIVKVFFL